MSKELITIDEKTAIEVFTSADGLEALIEEIEKTARSIIPDVSTNKGRSAIRSSAAKIASGKVKLDNLGKAVAADAKATVKLIDGNRRVVRDRLDSLKVEIRAPLTEFEDAEKYRIAAIENRFEMMKSLTVTDDGYGNDLAIHTLQANLKLLNSLRVDKEMFGEFEAEAKQTKLAYIKSHEDYIKRERIRIVKDTELKRLHQEAEERKKQERESELKRKAAEDARLEAERKVREETARIEYEKQEAIKQKEVAKHRARAAEKARAAAEKKAKAYAVAAEKRRIADVENAKLAEIKRQKQAEAKRREDEDKRANDLAHSMKIRIGASHDLMDVLHINADLANNIVSAIDDDQISNITINY